MIRERVYKPQGDMMMHMKKRLLVLAICITLLLAACGKKPATPADSKAEKEATATMVK